MDIVKDLFMDMDDETKWATLQEAIDAHRETRADLERQVAESEVRWRELRADIDDLDMESCDDDHQLGWCEAVAQVRELLDRERTADCVRVSPVSSEPVDGGFTVLVLKEGEWPYEERLRFAQSDLMLVRLKGVE